jgi:hypothetical protein
MKWGILAAFFCSCLTLAQDPADISAETHYRLLLENDQVRVYALTLRPDESARVRLRHSFMTVALQDGEIIIWDEGKSPIQHFQVHKGETSFHCWSPICVIPQRVETGVAGGFRNDRPNDYRNITVEFLDPNVGWSMTEGGTISYPASMFVGGALVVDVLLQSGDSFPAPDKPGPQLVIPVSEIDLKGGGGIRIRKGAGEVAWIPAGQTSALANAGRDAARFITIELRPGDSKIAALITAPAIP